MNGDAESHERVEKKTSNAVLKTGRWSPSFTSVAANEFFTNERSERSITSMALAESTCSLIEIGIPAARSSPMKSPRRLSNGLRPTEEFLRGAFDVGLVLQQDVQCLGGVLV